MVCQLVQSAVAKPTRAKRALTTIPENVENRRRSSGGIELTPTDLPLLAAPAVPTSPATTPPQLRNPAPPTASPPHLPAWVASALPPRDPNHTPSATKPTHPPDAPMPTPSNTDPTPTTPHPTQTAVAGPPAGSSKPETGGQPPAARHDEAEMPLERPAKPDAPATKQAGGSSHGSAGPQGASGKRKSPKARGSRGQGKKKGKGGDGGSGPSQPAVPPGLRGLRAAAAVAPAGRAAPAPQRLRMPQCVPPNARQQWAEAYTVVGHKVLDACANHVAQVRQQTSCRRCSSSVRSHALCSRTAAAAARVRQLRRGQPG